MHPRIKELYNLIKGISREKVLHIEVLFILKDYGATRAEATIALHLGFNTDLQVVDEFVINSKVWESEDPNEVFYQTLKYLYYKPDDPNYEANDDSVNISI